MSSVGSERTHEATFRVPATHPSLPGHFPGRPVVPGVVILDGVLECAADWLGRPLAVRALPQVKFLAPLLPEQEARLRLTLAGDSLRFEVTLDGCRLAQGACTLREAP
jgi:3-hydroxyacyl-[acyl-carrier-protein] dehydratase